MNSHFSFWNLVDEAMQAANGDLLTFSAIWEKKLNSLRPIELKDVQNELKQAVQSLSTWENFSAAWLYSGAPKPDFFLRYCEFIIAHGKECTEQIAANPSQAHALNSFNGRWQSVGLITLVAKASKSSGRKSLINFSDETLWQIVAQQLKVTKESKPFSTFIEDLKTSAPIRPNDWEAHFPKLAQKVKAQNVNPAVDRRTPMCEDKFWLILEESRNASDSTTHLKSTLTSLPTDQIVQFELITEQHIESAEKLIPSLRQSDPELQDLSDHEAAAWLVTLGQSGYQAITSDQNLWLDLRDTNCRWKGKRLLQTPREAFLEKTGHNFPALAA